MKQNNEIQTAVQLVPPDVNEIVSTLVKVKLFVGSAYGDAKSKEMSQELATAHGANAKKIRTSVRWLADDYKKKIDAAYSSLRGFFNRSTLPWEDGGYRIVPADRYQMLVDRVADLGDEYRNAANQIVAQWDDVMADARKELNGAMAKLEIPTAAQFVAGARYDLCSDVVVAPKDIRIAGLGEATVERIRSQAERNITDRIRAAIDSMLANLTNMLTDLIERTDKDKQKGTRYNGWAEWAKREVAAMRPLNFTDDERLNALMDRVVKLADSIDDSIRDDTKARMKVRAEAHDALDCFGIK